MKGAFQEFHECECQSFEIAAYIDGELDAERELELGMHLAECGLCSDELVQQKQFLCGLSSSLRSEAEIELPANFTKTIVANAQSSVSGLRRPSERFNAAFICAALFLFGLFALGADAAGTFGWLSNGFDKVAAVMGLVGHVAYSAIIVFAILTRTLSSQAQIPAAVSLFSVLVFAMIFASLSRRLVRVRRT